MSLRRELALTAGMLAGRPLDVLVQVTNRCNMRCSFCDFWPNGAPPSEELTAAEYARFAADLAARGPCLVSREGGEPLVRPDLVEIVRAFARHHLTVLYTNGWYVTPDLAQALFEAGLTQVGISIDYPDARHDRKRGLPGARERAWAAIDLCRRAAPHGGRQVHVMTVLTRDNARDVPALLEESRAHDVGYVLTLLSRDGYRRGHGPEDALPAPGIGRDLVALWDRHRHFRFFREYLERMDDFLSGGPLPACTAGQGAFNLDHVGQVAVCIETIDRPVGSVRDTPLPVLLDRLREREAEVSRCQACWTACRGFAQFATRPGPRSLWHLATRMRSR